MKRDGKTGVVGLRSPTNESLEGQSRKTLTETLDNSRGMICDA
jgi:hypothetical protein